MDGDKDYALHRNCEGNFRIKMIKFNAMKSEVKKLQLIEEIIKIKSQAVLMEIEAAVQKTMRVNKFKRGSAHDLSGLLTEEDAKMMDAAIEESCEQVNPDDWK